jgi:hypothetical protein
LRKQGGFYQGLTPTMLGIIPYSGINSWYFHDSNRNLVWHFCCITAIICSLLVLSLIIISIGTAWVVKQTLHEKFIIANERVPILIESLAMNAIAG